MVATKGWGRISRCSVRSFWQLWSAWELGWGFSHGQEESFPRRILCRDRGSGHVGGSEHELGMVAPTFLLESSLKMPLWIREWGYNLGTQRRLEDPNDLCVMQPGGGGRTGLFSEDLSFCPDEAHIYPGLMIFLGFISNNLIVIPRKTDPFTHGMSRLLGYLGEYLVILQVSVLPNPVALFHALILL